MPKKPKVSIAGVAEHVIQRGNNLQAIFACEDDMKAYVTWLKQMSFVFFLLFLTYLEHNVDIQIYLS